MIATEMLCARIRMAHICAPALPDIVEMEQTAVSLYKLSSITQINSVTTSYYFPSACTDGDVLLYKNGVLSQNLTEGTVFACYNDTYGSVCDDRWDSYDATVVCRQLGINHSNGV